MQIGGVTDERSVDLKGNREVNSEDKMTTQIDWRSLFSLFLLPNSPTLYHSLSFRYSRIPLFFLAHLFHFCLKIILLLNSTRLPLFNSKFL